VDGWVCHGDDKHSRVMGRGPWYCWACQSECRDVRGQDPSIRQMVPDMPRLAVASADHFPAIDELLAVIHAARDRGQAEIVVTIANVCALAQGLDHARQTIEQLEEQERPGEESQG
jgi:hypothetical protein